MSVRTRAAFSRAEGRAVLAQGERKGWKAREVEERPRDLFRDSCRTERESQPEACGAQMAPPTHRPCRPGSKDRHEALPLFAARREGVPRCSPAAHEHTSRRVVLEPGG